MFIVMLCVRICNVIVNSKQLPIISLSWYLDDSMAQAGFRIQSPSNAPMIGAAARVHQMTHCGAKSWNEEIMVLAELIPPNRQRNILQDVYNY
jgi:hypothetical protein